MLDSHTLADDDLAIRLTSAGAGQSLRETAEALIALAPPVSPGQTYDVGPNCRRDDLYYRLEARRALQRMDPPKLGSIRRYA